MNKIDHESAPSRNIALGFGVVTIGLAVLFFLALLFAANRGLDYSDESYAYLWARYPFEYRFGLRLTGFLLHPIELLVRHSMTGLRMAGMFLTAASGILIGIIATSRADKGFGRLERAEIVSACGIAMFLSSIYWANTPSYQHMTVWGLALVLAGFAMLLREAPLSTGQQLWSAGFIAGGGLVLAFAKIPSAMAAAALTVGVVLFAGGRPGAAQWRMLGLIALIEAALLLVTAAFVSPSHIIDLLQGGLSLRAGQGGLLDVLLKHLDDISYIPSRSIWIVVMAAASITLAANSRLRRFGVVPLIAGLVLGVVVAYMTLRFANPVRAVFGRYIIPDHGTQLTLLAIALLALTTAIHACRNQKFSRENLLFALLLIIAPWIASLGTGNNFLWYTAIFSGFSGLAIILTTKKLPRLATQTVRLFVVLMSGATLYLAALHPYRLNKPIAEQNVPVRLDGLDGGTLLVDGPTADFFTNLHDRARAAGLSVGTPLFDLSGLGPGIHLVLGTKPPVYPWIAAGYPDSPLFLDKIWSLTPASLREQAWLLAPIDKTFQGATALNYLTPLDLNYELVLKAAEPQSGISVELWRPRSATAAGGS